MFYPSSASKNEQKNKAVSFPAHSLAITLQSHCDRERSRESAAWEPRAPAPPLPCARAGDSGEREGAVTAPEPGHHTSVLWLALLSQPGKASGQGVDSRKIILNRVLSTFFHLKYIVDIFSSLNNLRYCF